MGFLNWLKKGKDTEKSITLEREKEVDDDIDDLLEELNGPERPQLYYFQHSALPEAVFSNHPELMEELRNGADDWPLLHFWSKADLLCLQNGLTIDDDFSPFEDIQCHPYSSDVYSLYIYSMPQPLFPTEAFFVGIVHRNDENREHGEPCQGTRYFILEKAKGGSSMFCEWTRDNSHNNLGEITEPSLENFVATISEQINDAREQQEETTTQQSPLDPDILEMMENNSNFITSRFSEILERPVEYDMESLEAIESVMETQRLNMDKELLEKYHQGLSCFLGQTIIHLYGGCWLEDEYGYAVEVLPEKRIYPFNKVEKFLADGMEESFSSMLTAVESLILAGGT